MWPASKAGTRPEVNRFVAPKGNDAHGVRGPSPGTVPAPYRSGVSLMNRSTALLMAVTLAGPLAGVARAQYQAPVCLPQTDRGNGVELAVDPLGAAHIIHIDRIGGGLIRSYWDVGAMPVDDTLANGVSRFGFIEVDDTGVTTNAAGDLRVCFFDATVGALRVAIEGANGAWTLENVLAGMRAGDQCDVREAPNGNLVVAFHHDNRLKVGTRTAANTWNVAVANETANKDVGVDPGLAIAADGTLVIAHANVTDGPLRVTTKRANGAFATVDVNTAPFPAGTSPRVSFDAQGQLYVVHGLRPVRLDVDGDVNLVLTQGPIGGPYRNTIIDGDYLGGSNGAGSTAAGRLYIATRERSRGGLFPRADSLRMFEGLPGNNTNVVLDAWGAAAAEHQFRNVTLAMGPLGLPVVAYAVEVSAFLGMPGGGYTCLIRPVDSDGDRLPDAGEATLRTNPRSADSDGDGVSDGLEVLRDHTNPLRRDDLPPDPDAAVVDPPLPDMAIVIPPDPDAAVIDPPVPDMAVVFPPLPDAAVIDPPTPDAAVIDPPVPDLAVIMPPVPDAFVPPPPFDAGLRADARGAGGAGGAGGEGGQGAGGQGTGGQGTGGLATGGSGGETPSGGAGGQGGSGGAAAGGQVASGGDGGSPATGGNPATGGVGGSGGSGGAVAAGGSGPVQDAGAEPDATQTGKSGGGGSGCGVGPAGAPVRGLGLALFGLLLPIFRRRSPRRS